MNIYRFVSRVFSLFVFVLPLTCCTSGGSDGNGGNNASSSPNISERSLVAASDEIGQLSYDFSLQTSESAFQLLTYPGNNQIRLVALTGPQGPISIAPMQTTNGGATTLQSQVNVLNVPFTADDLPPGTYTATYQLIDSESFMPLGGAEVAATLLTKRDANLGTGAARVNFILVGPVGGNEELRDSLEAALGKTRSILSSAQVSLDVEWIEAQGPDILPDPRSNDPFYTALTQTVRPHAVNIVFGADTAGLGSPNDQYTISLRDGGIAVPSARSVAVVSIFAVAGSDGRFNYEDDGGQQIHDDEIQLAAEEISQLIAHFLGLSHIVENDGSRTLSSDALDDTQSCLTLVDCKIEKDIRGNLMFPFPIGIDGSDLDTYKRTELSSQQRMLLQRSVLVD